MSSLLSIDLPPAVAKLISQRTLDQYTVSEPASELESELQQLTVNDLFPDGISHSEPASCCLSGIWLLHNFLDRSHEISQAIHTREGSFWHAIMHRLEGDFWNSKYWYRKVGDHPVLETLSETEVWNAEEFVDRCESVQGSTGPAADLVQQSATAEWKALFEYCYQQATGD